jgi:hypothetical protein
LKNYQQNTMLSHTAGGTKLQVKGQALAPLTIVQTLREQLAVFCSPTHFRAVPLGPTAYLTPPCGGYPKRPVRLQQPMSSSPLSHTFAAALLASDFFAPKTCPPPAPSPNEGRHVVVVQALEDLKAHVDLMLWRAFAGSPADLDLDMEVVDDLVEEVRDAVDQQLL